MSTKSFFLACAIALTLFGCGPSQAEQLYSKAVQLEQQQGGGMSYPTIEAYRQVIRTAPNTNWADKAQQRIDAIQTHMSRSQMQSTILLNNLLNSRP